MSKVYVAIESGVYRHNIIGVFSNLDQAEQSAVSAIEQEHDHYHEVEIVEIKVNKDFDTWKDFEEYVPVVYRWNKVTSLVESYIPPIYPKKKENT